MSTWWQAIALDVRSHLEETGYFSSLTPIKCACGNCGAPPTEAELESEDSVAIAAGEYYQWWECAFCGRIVPFCFGQEDELFEFCDECAMAWFELLELSTELARRAEELREVAA
jgi:hypothetical protein